MQKTTLSRRNHLIDFPPQLNLENAKNSLGVGGPHHYNIFFLRVYMSYVQVCHTTMRYIFIRISVQLLMVPVIL